MNISVILTGHKDEALINDTLDSIHKYVSKDVLILLDGACWDSFGRDAKLNAPKIRGFHHDHFKSPHRNIFLGIRELYKKYPTSDWYCYCEYDVLFANSDFKKDLALLKEAGYWVAANDVRACSLKKLRLIDKIVKNNFPITKKMLGCCYFMSGEYVRKLAYMRFFDRFILYTNSFAKDHFPDFTQRDIYEYDLAEILIPSLAEFLGGKVYNLASWDIWPGIWRRNFIRYPMRFKPELELSEVYHESSIIHPSKDYHEQIRVLKRCRRNMSS